MRYILKPITGTAVAFVTMVLLMSCMAKNAATEQETDLQKRSRFFRSYMAETFPSFEITDGEYLFILPDGCTNCTKSTCAMLSLSPALIKGKYNAILISKATSDRLSCEGFSETDNVLIDSTNKLDKMAFDIAGIAVMKIENGQIVDKKSMTAEDFQNNPEAFFRPM